MYNSLTFLAALLCSVITLNAQSTYELNSNTAGWDGTDLANFTLTAGTGTEPLTYIIPDGLTLTTRFNSPLNFPCNSTFLVKGTLNYAGDSACPISIIADGTSDGTAQVTLGLLSSTGDLSLDYINLTNNTGYTGGNVTGDFTMTTDAGTTLSKAVNLTITGDAFFDLSGSGTISQSQVVGGRMSLTQSKGKFEATKAVNSFSGIVTGGELDLKSPIAGTANISLSGTAQGKLASTIGSKFRASLDNTAKLDVNEAVFNNRSNLSALGFSKLNLNTGTRFTSTLAIDVSPDAEMEVNGIVDMTGEVTSIIEGRMNSKGEFKMSNSSSTLELKAGAILDLPLVSSKLKIGAFTKSGIASLVGPLVLDESSLPVELLSFSVVKDRKDYRVDWVTGSEINIEKYELLRSTNGSSSEVIHREYNIENTNEIKRYTYTDFSYPEGTTLYYQLRTVNLDGTTELSDIRSITGSRPDQEASIFPNPAWSQTTIDAKADAKMEIFNFTGTKILETQVEKGKTPIDLRDFKKGVYVFVFSYGYDHVETKRLMVQND